MRKKRVLIKHIIRNQYLGKKKKSSNFLLPGYVDDIVSAYCGADAFCFPSHGENEGIPLLEAWACSLPVIASRIPPFQEKITNNKNGLLAQELNEYEKSIRELMDNKNKREKLIKKGYKEVKKYDLKKTSKQMIDMFKKVLQDYKY